MRWVLVLLVGSVLGLAAAVGNAATGPDPAPTVRALGIVTGLGMVWVAAMVLGGFLVSRAPWSVLAGPLVLLSAAAAYYVWETVTSDRAAGLGDLGSRTRLLLLAGVLAAPMLGLLGDVARTGNLPGTLARMFVPIGLAAEVLVRDPLHSVEFSADPTLAWTSTCVLVAGVLGAAIAMISGQTSSSQ